MDVGRVGSGRSNKKQKTLAREVLAAAPRQSDLNDALA